ncbi:MAG: guanylate kinase [Defluviitaleaceae bacterium]|nr:guanylate kinase [Defluviitaleaceae bacterium]
MKEWDEGMLLIISGPSGSGKGTVTKKLLPEDGFALSVSMTTREQREGETHGRDYVFCTEEEFMKTRDLGGFLEHATFCGHYYGTPISYVQHMIDNGWTVVLEIEVEGALQVREKYPDSTLIFLMPPTLGELRKRLIMRGREGIDEIERRMRRANEEIELIPKYDYLVVNDDVGLAVKEINLIVNAEHLRTGRSRKKVDNFFATS